MPIQHKVMRGSWGQVEVRSEFSELLDIEANLAVALIERWGLVAWQPDGEDTAGRQKLRKSTPLELVTEACDTAAVAYSEFRRRGWVTPALTQSEAVDLVEATFPSKPRAELKFEPKDDAP